MSGMRLVTIKMCANLASERCHSCRNVLESVLRPVPTRLVSGFVSDCDSVLQALRRGICSVGAVRLSDIAFSPPDMRLARRMSGVKVLHFAS